MNYRKAYIQVTCNFDGQLISHLAELDLPVGARPGRKHIEQAKQQFKAANPSIRLEGREVRFEVIDPQNHQVRSSQ